jgi:alkylation response protein AidB-like acyl-CoA dehydrogenase
MTWAIPEDSRPIHEMFERFFEAESTPARVRAAEPAGFDPQLWNSLVELGAPIMRVPEAFGGGGMRLLDACLMMAQAGRRLASAPLAEAIAAAGVLAAAGGDLAAQWISALGSGEKRLALALHDLADGPPQLVPGGAVADAIVCREGDAVLLVEPAAPLAAPVTLAGNAIGLLGPVAGRRTEIATGAQAVAAFEAGLEEWKLLVASALNGLSREALVQASAYACERIQFGVPIGTYQGISHPLANDIIEVDGSDLLITRTLKAMAAGSVQAPANVSLAFWWSARTASKAVAHALHTYGGYGLTNEYDVQLYHRRAKAWAMPLGDPAKELLRAGRRAFLGETACLPDAGPMEEDFSTPEHAVALADETRALFEKVLTPELRAKAHYSFEGHDWGVSKALGEAGLLFPDWPAEWGGRDVDIEANRASTGVWEEFEWTTLPRGVTGMIGKLVMQFGSDALKQEVLPRMGRGEIIASLGYTEPGCGSDVFGAQTRAVRDGDDWVINGQKMFTSGADLASYVFLLTRTDPDLPKHKGLTLFLVPLDLPGVEIHPVHTFMDERTNATFYSDVRIPDHYRVGPVDGGIRVMSAALQMEQGGASYHRNQRRMIAEVLEWARDEGRLDEADLISRLARVLAHAEIGEALARRVLDASRAGAPDEAYGPASKVFTTETFIADSADLLDLTAPASLVRGRTGIGLVEESYRHATATSIYGGTSEVLRSMVAERRLGLPRSRA